jgi:hypothetical protein
MIRFQCPTCAKILQADDLMAGATGKCTGCGQRCTIPAANAPVPPPIVYPPQFVRPIKARPKRRLPSSATVIVSVIVVLAIFLALIYTLRHGPGVVVFSEIVVAALIGFGYFAWLGNKKLKSMAPDWGPVNRAMVCPHCQTKGQVHTKNVVHYKGVDGGKAIAAFLTGGLSLLFIGLSRDEGQTQAHCCDCDNTWEF